MLSNEYFLAKFRLTSPPKICKLLSTYLPLPMLRPTLLSRTVLLRRGAEGRLHDAVQRRERVLVPRNWQNLQHLANFQILNLQIFGGLVLDCIKTKFCKKICVCQHFSSSTKCAHFCTAPSSTFSKITSRDLASDS